MNGLRAASEGGRCCEVERFGGGRWEVEGMGEAIAAR